MRSKLFDGQPFLRIGHQEMPDEILGLGSDLLPDGIRKGELGLDEEVEAAALEGQVTREQLEEQDTHAPEIDLVVVALAVVVLGAVEDLGAHPAGGAAEAGHPELGVS